MYEAVLFDVDGVLLRGRQTDAGVYEAAARRIESEFDAANGDIVDHLVSPVDVDAVRTACADAGVPADEVWARREALATAFELDHLDAGRRQPFGDIDHLRGLDRPVGLVSSNRDGFVARVADRLSIPAQVTIGREPALEDFVRRKPEPDFLHRALDALGNPEAIYVGDRRTDTVAAGRAGIDAALLDRPDAQPLSEPRRQGETAARPIETIEGLDELDSLV